MEWNTPKPFERREKVFFAWFPLECEDGKTRWLCKLRGIEQYQPGFDPMEPWYRWDLIKVYPLTPKPGHSAS